MKMLNTIATMSSVGNVAREAAMSMVCVTGRQSLFEGGAFAGETLNRLRSV